MTRYLIILISLFSLSASAFCIHNHTDAKFKAKVTYDGWLFKKTFTVKPYQTFCKTDIEPGQAAKYDLSNTRWDGFNQTISWCKLVGSTSTDIDINGFWDFFHCSKR